MSFKEKVSDIIYRKKTTLIAGVDPAEFEMGRGEKGLPRDVLKFDWTIEYIKAIAPFSLGIKLNAGYWMGENDIKAMKEIVKFAKSQNLIVIMDSKIADIGSTNDAWMYYWQKLGFDAITIAPYAGNIEDAINTAKNRNLGVFSMGLMSNPEFKTEMNFKNKDGIPLWQTRSQRALQAGVDGLVLGGTYNKDDVELINFLDITKKSDTLYLVPGIGEQGGKLGDFYLSGIDANRALINVGRGLMFCNGQNTTPEDQARVASKLQYEIQKYL